MQLVATSPPVRARQLAELIESDALTTSGTSMNAVNEPLSLREGHSAHSTDATSPQKYCGFASIVSRLV